MPLKIRINAIEILFQTFYLIKKNLVHSPCNYLQPRKNFSTLKRVKIYFRNTSGQERLNGLALISVCRVNEIDNREAVNTFALQKASKGNYAL